MAPVRPKGPRTLGVVALAIALISIAAGGTLLYLAGRELGGVAQFPGIVDLIRGGKQVSPGDLPESAQPIVANASLLTGIGYIVWGVLAVWAIIQGVVATAQRRGRAWGITAVVIAVIGYLVVRILYTAGLWAGMAPFV